MEIIGRVDRQTNITFDMFADWIQIFFFFSLALSLSIFSALPILHPFSVYTLSAVYSTPVARSEWCAVLSFNRYSVYNIGFGSQRACLLWKQWHFIFYSFSFSFRGIVSVIVKWMHHSPMWAKRAMKNTKKIVKFSAMVWCGHIDDDDDGACTAYAFK